MVGLVPLNWALLAKQVRVSLLLDGLFDKLSLIFIFL